MAFSSAARNGKALTLALSVLCQAFPAFCAQPDRRALDGLFDSGTGAAPLAFFAQQPAAGQTDFIRPQAVAADVLFDAFQVPRHMFSREQSIAKTLVSIIDKTRFSMDLALYVISLPDVTEAVIRAKERGVAVRIIMDHNNTFPSATAAPRSKELELLIRNGVTIRTLRGGIMHNKFGIYDAKLLSSGSFNWTVTADTRHFENILFRDQPEFLIGFQDYFNWMWMQATPLSGKQSPDEDWEPSDDIKPSIVFKGQAWQSFVFSPRGGTQELLIKAIDLCAKRLDIAMFSFFSEGIAEAVVRAKKRGVAVRVIMDKGEARNIAKERGFREPSMGTMGALNRAKQLLRENEVDLKFSFGRDGENGIGILHHKFAIFDGEMLGTGSFNYSKNAEASNYENVIFSAEAQDVQVFSREFEFLYGQIKAPPVSSGSAR